MALPDGMSSCAMCVEIMADATTFTDYSDEVSVVESPALARMTAEGYVFGEDTALLGYGKREPGDVVIRGVYTESTTSAFYIVETSYETACGALCAIRWSPGGCTTDNRSFRTSTTVSKVINLVYPGGDSASADILTWEATIRTPDLTEAAWS